MATVSRPKKKATQEGTLARIGGKARQHLYLTQWRDHFNLSDDDWAQRVGVTRTTIWRWQVEQWRLDPGKIFALAKALDAEFEPEQFWRLPSRPSVDAILKDAPIEVIAETMADAARRVAKRR